MDDFCRAFIAEWQKNQLDQGEKKRNRAHRMSDSEMITILVSYHQAGFSNLQMVLPEACATLLAV